MLEEYKTKQPLFYNYISKIIENNKISHAYLIETNGISYAYNLAISMVKEFLYDKNTMSKEQYQNLCNNIDNDNYPDLKIIDTDTKNIKKGQLLDLQRDFSVKPIYGKYLIYIIKDANLLNNSSANTILKFLEEPSENIIAILLTNNIYNVIDTIVSRCQILSLLPEETNINSILMKYYVPSDVTFEEYKSNIEEKSINIYKQIEELGCETIAFGNPYILKENLEIFFSIGLQLYFDILNNKLKKDNIYYKNYSNIIEEISEKNTINDIIKKIDIINKFNNYLNFNVNKELYIDNFIITLTGGNNDRSNRS